MFPLFAAQCAAPRRRYEVIVRHVQAEVRYFRGRIRCTEPAMDRQQTGELERCSCAPPMLQTWTQTRGLHGVSLNTVDERS